MKKLKEKLNAKLSKNGGFTLIEMLIVVAIIAILIAVSIPLVNGALEKARDATDQANERAAKAEALLFYMGTVSDSELLRIGGGTNAYVPGTKLEGRYDAEKGILVTKSTTVEPYGKCTKQADCYQTTKTHAGCWIEVTIDPADTTNPNEVQITWTNS